MQTHNAVSAVSSDPPINFVLYIPQQSQTPLYILKSDGGILGTNGFLIPRWGGIIIQNAAFDSRKQLYFNADQLHEFMEFYVQQLRSLMGIKPLTIKHHSTLLVFFDLILAWAQDNY